MWHIVALSFGEGESKSACFHAASYSKDLVNCTGALELSAPVIDAVAVVAGSTMVKSCCADFTTV